MRDSTRQPQPSREDSACYPYARDNNWERFKSKNFKICFFVTLIPGGNFYFHHRTDSVFGFVLIYILFLERTHLQNCMFDLIRLWTAAQRSSSRIKIWIRQSLTIIGKLQKKFFFWSFKKGLNGRTIKKRTFFSGASLINLNKEKSAKIINYEPYLQDRNTSMNLFVLQSVTHSLCLFA